MNKLHLCLLTTWITLNVFSNTNDIHALAPQPQIRRLSQAELFSLKDAININSQVHEFLSILAQDNNLPAAELLNALPPKQILEGENLPSAETILRSLALAISTLNTSGYLQDERKSLLFTGIYDCPALARLKPYLLWACLEDKNINSYKKLYEIFAKVPLHKIIETIKDAIERKDIAISYDLLWQLKKLYEQENKASITDSQISMIIHRRPKPINKIILYQLLSLDVCLLPLQSANPEMFKATCHSILSNIFQLTERDNPEKINPCIKTGILRLNQDLTTHEKKASATRTLLSLANDLLQHFDYHSDIFQGNFVEALVAFHLAQYEHESAGHQDIDTLLSLSLSALNFSETYQETFSRLNTILSLNPSAQLRSHILALFKQSLRDLIKINKKSFSMDESLQLSELIKDILRQVSLQKIDKNELHDTYVMLGIFFERFLQDIPEASAEYYQQFYQKEILDKDAPIDALILCAKSWLYNPSVSEKNTDSIYRLLEKIQSFILQEKKFLLEKEISRKSLWYAWRLLSEQYLQNNNSQQALSCFIKMEELYSQNVSWGKVANDLPSSLEKALLFDHLEDKANALKQWYALLEGQDESVSLQRLARSRICHWGNLDKKELLSQYEAALQSATEDTSPHALKAKIWIHYYYGYFLEEQGSLSEAIDHWMKALQHKNMFKPAERIRLYRSLAKAFLAGQKEAEAEKYFENLLAAPKELSLKEQLAIRLILTAIYPSTEKPWAAIEQLLWILKETFYLDSEDPEKKIYTTTVPQRITLVYNRCYSLLRRAILLQENIDHGFFPDDPINNPLFAPFLESIFSMLRFQYQNNQKHAFVLDEMTKILETCQVFEPKEGYFFLCVEETLQVMQHMLQQANAKEMMPLCASAWVRISQIFLNNLHQISHNQLKRYLDYSLQIGNTLSQTSHDEALLIYQTALETAHGIACLEEQKKLAEQLFTMHMKKNNVPQECTYGMKYLKLSALDVLMEEKNPELLRSIVVRLYKHIADRSHAYIPTLTDTVSSILENNAYPVLLKSYIDGLKLLIDVGLATDEDKEHYITFALHAAWNNHQTDSPEKTALILTTLFEWIAKEETQNSLCDTAFAALEKVSSAFDNIPYQNARDFFPLVIRIIHNTLKNPDKTALALETLSAILYRIADPQKGALQLLKAALDQSPAPKIKQRILEKMIDMHYHNKDYANVLHLTENHSDIEGEEARKQSLSYVFSQAYLAPKHHLQKALDKIQDMLNHSDTFDFSSFWDAYQFLQFQKNHDPGIDHKQMEWDLLNTIVSVACKNPLEFQDHLAPQESFTLLQAYVEIANQTHHHIVPECLPLCRGLETIQGIFWLTRCGEHFLKHKQLGHAQMFLTEAETLLQKIQPTPLVQALDINLLLIQTHPDPNHRLTCLHRAEQFLVNMNHGDEEDIYAAKISMENFFLAKTFMDKKIFLLCIRNLYSLAQHSSPAMQDLHHQLISRMGLAFQKNHYYVETTKRFLDQNCFNEDVVQMFSFIKYLWQDSSENFPKDQSTALGLWKLYLHQKKILRDLGDDLALAALNLQLKELLEFFPTDLVQNELSLLTKEIADTNQRINSNA